MGEWRYTSTIDLGTRWRRVISFTPHQLYLRRKSPRYPFEPVYESCGEEKNLAPVWVRTSAIQPVARRCTAWAIQTHFFISSFLLFPCYGFPNFFFLSRLCLYVFATVVGLLEYIWPVC
jgi:hypothetical protein